MAPVALADIRVVPSSIELACSVCGESGTVSREAGDIHERAVDWANAHCRPRIVAVWMVAAHNGRPLGVWRYVG